MKTIVSSFPTYSSGGRSVRTFLLASALALATASAAVTDISGDLEIAGLTLDQAVGPGNSGRLIGDTKTNWPSGTFISDVDLNSFKFTINNGGGNDQTYNGTFTGPGILALHGRSTADWTPDIRLGGASANTPTSVSITQGRVQLNKTPGVDALAGPITINTGTTVRLQWIASNQINDASVITTTASSGAVFIMINSQTDTIAGLDLKTGHKVETTSGGVLTVTNLTVGGVVQWPGTYTSADGFVTGPGSVVVTGTEVDISGAQTDTIDNVVGLGNSARMIGDTTFSWQPGTFNAPVKLNSFNLEINTGGGNAQIYNQVLTGPGTLTLVGNATADIAFPVDITLGGPKSNTPTDVTLTQGRINLNKTPGKDALAGPITVNTGSGNTAMLIWNANDQINDASTIDSTGAVGTFIAAIGSYQDSVKSLKIKSGDSVDTTGGGILAVDVLEVGGIFKPAGTYTSADGFVVGTGSILVTAIADADTSTVEASPTSVMADGTGVTVTVTLRDAGGNPVQGKSVALVSSRGGDDTISAPSGISNVSGVVTFTVSSWVEGDSDYTASIPLDSLTITDTASVTYEFNPYTNISNALTPKEPLAINNGVNINETVPSGKIARLVGETKTHWNSNTVSRPIFLNGYQLRLDSGGGNVFTVNSTITGDGLVEYKGGGVQALNIGGAEGNTYTGTNTVTAGPVRLQKSSGNVISGSTVTINGIVTRTDIFPNSGTLLWAGDNQVNDSTNFVLQNGSMQLDGHIDTVGTATLTGDFTIRLGTAITSNLHFANSSATSWTAAKTLSILEWDGNYAGGGGEGIFFGNSSAGLTGGQLAQISFVNPTGVAAGTYGAKILSTGEVVPNTAPPGYDSWATDYAGGQEADDDFDGDGVLNGVEYFMGETGSSFTPNPTLDEAGTILWNKSASFFGTFEVQISYDLENWEPAPEEALLDFGNAIMLDATEVTPEDGKLFIRLFVSPSDPE
jgi:hypothetical protein